MNSAACRNLFGIRRAGRYIERSQREVAAEDAGPDARSGWPALVNAATAREGTCQASYANPAAEQVPAGALTLTQATRTHTVRAPHRLSSIGQRFYGNAADWHRTDAASQPMIVNPNPSRTVFPAGAYEGQC